MNDPDANELKSRLLPPLLDELRRVRERRSTARRAVGVACLLAMSALTAWLALPPSSSRHTSTIASRAASAISRITSDPAVVREWTIRTSPITDVQMLNDDTLLTYLSTIGRPSGIVRSEGRTWLTAPIAGPRPSGPG